MVTLEHTLENIQEAICIHKLDRWTQSEDHEYGVHREEAQMAKNTIFVFPKEEN